jgi:hypothetical protein
MNRWDKQKLLAGPRQTSWVQEKCEAREGLSPTRGRGQDGCIREVPQGIAAQVCINVYNKFVMFVICWKIENVI